MSLMSKMSLLKILMIAPLGSVFALEFDSGATYTVRPEVFVSRSSIHGDLGFTDMVIDAYRANGMHPEFQQTSMNSLNYGLGAIVFTPEWNRLSFGLGTHLVHSNVYISCDARPDSTSVDDENQEVDFVNWNLDLQLTTQWRPFKRHLFAVNYRLSGITFGDQSAERYRDEKRYLTEKGNYRALMNQFSVSYAYRILDRIEIGFEYGLNDPDYFRDKNASGNLSYDFSSGGGREKRIRISWPINL